MVSILDIVFPKRCVGCRKVGKYICVACQKTIQLQIQRCPECDRPAIDGKTHPFCLKRFGLDGLTTVFLYDGVVKKAIKSIKYRFVYDIAESLMNLIPPRITQSLGLLPKNLVIYPIPLHKDRLKWRGFNQAEKLGEILAKKLNLKLVDGLLTRREKRTPQADIAHREDRIKNAQGLFRINQLTIHNQQSAILLLDDVWTTGATMKEATRVLKKGGVRFVWGMTIAR